MLNTFVRQTPIKRQSELEQLRRAFVQFNITVDQLLLDLMQPCENLVKQCLWLNKPMPCSELFQISMTSLGACCSFNYIGTSK